MNYKAKNIVFGIIWILIFALFAFYIYSGKLFEPDANGKLNIVAILVAWVVEYLTQLGTALLVMAIGLAVGVTVALSRK